MRARTRQRKRSSRIKTLSGPVLALIATFYFLFHALNGELGLFGRATIQERIRELEAQRDVLKQERIILQRRVLLLSPKSLDPDLVDERARASLNLVHPDDVAIMLDD
ncbi:FtsB family cell division protein [Polycladidibacter stylochi]|uniref:FtsB family cell division protein n=1 Tax=Polycladidibacter stylochi TaxID=1807766 RepID=UPI0009EAE5C4|nr:septum formation initiator family protein [Pseudovibrio stylochi]